jgi:LPS-assembly protein
MIPTLLLPPARRRWLLLLAALQVLSASARAQDSNQWECDANAEHNPCMPPAASMDWVDVEPGAATQCGLKERQCGGYYVDPLADVDQSIDPARTDIKAHANQTEMEGDEVRFFGGVEASQGYRRLSADTATVDKVKRTGLLEGNVELREPDLLLRGSSATVNSETGEAVLKDSHFVLHKSHVRGGAARITRREDEIIELDHGHYTYCPPDSDLWILQAENLELDLEEGTGTARNATIEMGGIPLFYTPYLKFPLDNRRKSGFLWPEMGNDSNGGADVALPYYFNLAPNYDATLTPRYIGDRGLLTELELRYLGNNVGYWELGGGWISGDDQYQDDFPDDDGNRWLTAVEQHGLFARRWRSEIDFTKTGDDDYFRDLGTTSLEVKQSTHLAQRGQMDYLGDKWLFQMRVEEFQTIARDINDDPYRKLPQMSMIRTALPDAFEPNLIMTSDYTYFDHASRRKGHRLYNELGVSYPMSWIFGFLNTQVKYRQLNYDLDAPVFADDRLDDTPDVGAPLFTVDGGLIFERDLNWGGQTYLQTFEPRAYYLWADYENQTGLPDFDTSELTFAFNQLFRDTRFSGHDRLDDANQASLGITTRIIDPESGVERLHASIGQIHYFRDREVTLGAQLPEDREGSSSIALEFGLAPSDTWDMRSSWLWNTDDEKLDQSYVQIGYRGNNQRIFNLGHSYRRYVGTDPEGEDIDQVDFSTYFPVDDNWSIFLRSLYDLEEKDRVNDMVGIEYNDCCWRVRLVYQRALEQSTGANVDKLVEHEQATYLQFQLKGLGGVGDQVTSLLEEFIRGYEERDD